MEKNLPELIGVKDLMEYFDCGIDAAYMLVRRRDFPSFKMGNKHYVVKDKLADWVEKECRKKKKHVGYSG